MALHKKLAHLTTYEHTQQHTGARALGTGKLRVQPQVGSP